MVSLLFAGAFRAAFSAQSVEGHLTGFDRPVKMNTGVFLWIERSGWLHVQNTAAAPAYKVVVLRNVPVKMLQTVIGAELCDLPLVTQEREVAVDRAEADVRVDPPHIVKDHVSRRMVTAAKQVVPDRFALAAVFGNRHSGLLCGDEEKGSVPLFTIN